MSGVTASREAAAQALHPALVSAGDAHIFAVFGDRTAGYVDAGVVEFFSDLFVGEGFGAVFLFNHFLDDALQGEQGHGAAFWAIH